MWRIARSAVSPTFFTSSMTTRRRNFVSPLNWSEESFICVDREGLELRSTGQPRAAVPHFLFPRYSYLLPERSTAMATGYSAGRMVAHNMVTTQFELDGFRVTRTLGVVRGIVVRSRSIFGTIGAGLQTLVGGNITLLTNLCEKTRAEAFDLMLQHAAELGGNAVVGARYDATEVMQGVTEVLAYGTAVFVEPAK
jgi:uncharacterized protein YbjQ (UPF0145 family)